MNLAATSNSKKRDDHKQKITKVVIPVAGLGTRMLPATKAIPKEMLPIVDKPLIQYIVNECIASGITEIILVTHSSKNAIENHFDTSYELESTLEKRIKRQLLEEIQQICPKHVTIMHVRQGLAKGLGHAVLCARPLVGEQPFAVVLPDVLIDDYYSDLSKDNLAAMIKAYEQSNASQVMVEAIPRDLVSNYGIADIGSLTLEPNQHQPMQAIIEKPSIKEAPSNLAVVGRYVLSKKIWPLLAKTPLGIGDEIQLTDAIEMLMHEEAVHAFQMKGRSHDCGNKLGYMQAFVMYGKRHPVHGADFCIFLDQLKNLTN